MSLQEQFDKAAADIKNLKARPSDQDLLEIYALFKQATVGDADPANKPGMLDLKGKAKYNAWEAKKGTSKEAAMEAYVAKAKSLIETLGTQ
ncbi:acyl coA binding protein domain-containing protein [Phthorimaea operculella]|nr:acyl coA binding protein domain-containing protein [Phthorimaea operculella]